MKVSDTCPSLSHYNIKLSLWTESRQIIVWHCMGTWTKKIFDKKLEIICKFPAIIKDNFFIVYLFFYNLEDVLIGAYSKNVTVQHAYICGFIKVFLFSD